MKTLLLIPLLLATIVVHAQTSVPGIITYQGRVTVAGQPYTGTGLFKFALVDGGVNTSRQAYAFATVDPGGSIMTVTITDGGAGYLTPPEVSFSSPSGGSGASATAIVAMPAAMGAGGAVTSITLNNPGSGYGSTPFVTIAPPPVYLANFVSYWSHDGTSLSGNAPFASWLEVPVKNGLFTVALGDTNVPNMSALPPEVLTNTDVHLRIWFDVGEGQYRDGGVHFEQLTPDQPLTAAPYALVAQKAMQLEGTSTGPVTLNNSGNSFSGNGAGLTAVNASTLGGLAVSNFWKLGGNAGTTTNNFIGTSDNQPLVLLANNQSVMRLSPNYSVAVGESTTASGYASTALGGGTTASGEKSTAMGINTTASEFYSTAMGSGTTASGTASTAMGESTIASGEASTAMGILTTASGDGSTAMGIFSLASGEKSTAMGQAARATNIFSTAMGVATTAGGIASTAMGTNTTANGAASTAMGSGSVALGNYSFAAGKNATATHNNSFIWSDGSDTFGSGAANTFNVLASGGYQLYTGTGHGVSLAHDDTSWGVISDRNAKKNFAPLDGKTVLAKLAAVPVQQWNYKWEKDTDVPNIGPMAQDFKAAFYPGRDDKTITTLEFDGVEMAAIQGLNQKLEEQKAENADLHQKLDNLARQKDAALLELKARLEKLEQLIILKNGAAK